LALALCVAAMALGGYVYFVLWRYEERAHLHVPAGTNIALRGDANEILLFGPVREHLWPLVLGRDAGERARHDAILEHTGVDVPRDLREIVIASLDGQGWVAIVGGNIAPDRFVAGLHRVLSDEGRAGWSLDGELLVHALGPVIGQADDGVIIVGTGRDIAMAALAGSEEAAALPLARDAALSFMLNAKAYDGAIGLLPHAVVGLDALAKIEQLSGTMTLSDTPMVAIDVTPKPGVAPDALAEEMRSSLLQLRVATMLVPHDLFGAKRAISDASVESSDSAVRVTAPWPYPALDAAVKRLAEAIAP
jgi:hypothetical protein